MQAEIHNIHTNIFPETRKEYTALYLLAAKLTVMAPGAEYTWRFKQKRWDGKVRVIHYLADKEYFSIPTGYLPFVVDQLKEYLFTYSDYRNVQQLNLRNTSVTLRPYQWDACTAIFQNTFQNMWWPRGIIRFACGLGKTETAIAAMQMADQFSVFLVNRKSLLHQTYERCRKYGLPAGRIGDDIYDPSKITIATVQTLASYIENEEWPKLDFIRYVRFVIADEAHGIAASLDGGNQFHQVLAVMQYAPIRIGLSATPFLRDKYSNMLLEGATGPILVNKDTRWGIDNGYLSDAKVKMVKVKALPDVLFKVTKKEKTSRYAKAYKEAIEMNVPRNQAIIDEMQKLPGPTLILIRTIAHGNMILNLAQQQGINLPFITGKNTQEERQAAVDQMEKTKGNLMTTSIFDEGIDLPGLRGLVLAAGGKSESKLLQRMGRGLRLHADKDGLEVVDFFDLSRPLLSHSKGRHTLWETEKYNVTIVDP